MQEMEMKSRVRGRVLLPGEEGYDAERTGWSGQWRSSHHVQV